MPQWSFYFAHPEGGHGRIDIQVGLDRHVYLHQFWTVDDYRRWNRRCKHVSNGKIIDTASLEETMLAAIHGILTWRPAELGDLGGISRVPVPTRRYPEFKP